MGPAPKGLIPALGLGGLAAVLVLSALHGGPVSGLIANVAPLPLYVAGLGWGLGACLVAGAVLTLIMGLSGGVFAGLATAVIFAAAPVALTRLALLSRPDGRGGREWYPAGDLVAWTTYGGLALLGAAFLYGLASHEGGLRALVSGALAEAFSSPGVTQMLEDAGFEAEARERFFTMIVAMAPAIAAGGFIFMHLLSGALGQILVERSGIAARPAFAYSRMELPRELSYAIFVAMLLAFAPGELGWAGSLAASLLAIPFFLLGLAVLHVISRGLPGRPLLLTGLYVFVLAFAWLGLIVVCVGLAEPMMRLRERYGGAT